MSEDLLRLAERVEKLEGPDREVDLEIARYRGVTVWKRNDDDTGNYETTHWHYTASIDAAMTMAGQGYHLAFDVHFMDDENVIRYRGYSFRPDWAKWNPHDMAWLNRDGSESPLCATPALAITSAALRARASIGKGE